MPEFSNIVEKRSSKGQEGLFALVPLSAGDVITTVVPKRAVEVKSRWTLQLSENAHCEGHYLGIAAYLNHSCDGNVSIDIPAFPSGLSKVEEREIWDGNRSFRIVANRDIAVGEEVMFNYLTTESDMAEGFACLCGSPNCLGQVRGYIHLPRADKVRLLPQGSPSFRRHVYPGLVEKRKKNDMLGVYATEELGAGLPILEIFPVAPVAKPTRYTLELSPHAHIRHEDLEWCAFLNHSCDPNVSIVIPPLPASLSLSSSSSEPLSEAEFAQREREFWDGTRPVSIVTRRSIKKDEEITFHYCTTESVVAEPFQCSCGSDFCLREIVGFVPLSDEKKKEIIDRFEVSPSIAAEYQKVKVI